MRLLAVFCVLALLSLSSAVPSHQKHRTQHSRHHNAQHAHHQKQQKTYVEKKQQIDHLLMKVAAPKKPRAKAGEVCTTPECNVSANEIIGSMDNSTDPCDDFYRFACGNYYDTHLPIDGSQGMFYAVDDEVTAELDYILNTPALPGDPGPVQDTRVHYNNCMDTDTMDAFGLSPLWNQLISNGYAGWPIAMDVFDNSSFSMYQSLEQSQAIGMGTLIAVGISSNFLNTSYNILYIAEGSLGLSSTYLLEPNSYPDQITAYTTFISDSAKQVRDYLGSSVTDAEIEAEASSIVAFESAVANVFSFVPHSKNEVLEKTDVTYLQSITDDGVPGQFDWLTYLTTMFSGTDVLIDSTEPVFIYGEPFFAQFSTLLSTTDTRTLSNYIAWRFVKETSTALNYAMRNITLKYDNAMFGTTGFTARDVHCRVQTQYDLNMPLSRAYVDNNFDTSAKPQVQQLVELIRSAFQSLLDENDWMAPDDLVVAKEKLAFIYSRVAYPDWIMDDAEMELAYQGLDIVPNEQFDNLMRMANFYNYWNLETFRNTPTIGWFLPPTVVNAFYDPLTNSITILAAIIQFPFYVQNSLAAVNYGAIGMVIGHEMTHGFDNTGRHFDKDGNLANWWSQESVDGFNNRSQCFVDQYDTYEPPEFAGTQYEGTHVNGQQTLGENIADNGGIREAYRAYVSYVAAYGEEPTLAGLESYTPYQLFFLGFANVWCEHKTAEALNSQINSDPHSPGQFRIIGPLSNDADFWNAWNCPDSSAMNRGSEACFLW